MKTTEAFKQTIKSYLDSRAANDDLFAAAYAKEGKNIDDCVTYILNEVQKSGCNGFNDDEIFGMAVHYYDEDNIDIGKEISASRIIVNHVVELTEEDKEEARKQAIEDYRDRVLRELGKKAKEAAEKKVEKKAKNKQPKFELPSLF